MAPPGLRSTTISSIEETYRGEILTSNDSPNFYAPWGGEWAIWGGSSWKFSERATFNLQVSYDEFEDIAAVANVAYTVVPNFVITPEIAYVDNLNDDFDDVFGEDEDVVDENWGFFIRAQANFGG